MTTCWPIFDVALTAPQLEYETVNAENKSTGSQGGIRYFFHGL